MQDTQIDSRRTEVINSFDVAISSIDEYLRLSKDKYQSNTAEIEKIISYLEVYDLQCPLR